MSSDQSLADFDWSLVLMYSCSLPSELPTKFVFYAITVNKLVTERWVTSETVHNGTMQNEESVFIGHMDILFCEVSIHIFCPYLNSKLSFSYWKYRKTLYILENRVSLGYIFQKSSSTLWFYLQYLMVFFNVM